MTYVPGEGRIYIELCRMGVPVEKADALAPELAALAGDAFVEPEPTSLRDMVRKTVVEYLGREPIGKAEEVQVRMKIYKANPGLSQAVRDEERIERLGGGLATQTDEPFPRCGECGRPYSPGAVNCPSCGARIPSQKSAGSVREWRDAAVRAHLGREPIGKAEEVQVRMKIHKANPGLAQACRDEEAAERRGE